MGRKRKKDDLGIELVIILLGFIFVLVYYIIESIVKLLINIFEEVQNSNRRKHKHSSIETKPLIKQVSSENQYLLSEDIINEQTISAKNKSIPKPKNVPVWKHFYIYSYDDIQFANIEQKEFYYYFRDSLLNGEMVDIRGNSNYAFILYFELLKSFEEHKDIDLLRKQFDLLTICYPKTRPYSSSALRKMSEKIDLDSGSHKKNIYEKSQQNQRDYSSKTSPNKLGKQFQKQLGLNQSDIILLNKLTVYPNKFLSDENNLISTISNFLKVINTVEGYLSIDGSSLDIEIDYINRVVVSAVRKQTPSRLIENDNYLRSSVESNIYEIIFKKTENLLRSTNGINNKVKEYFLGYAGLNDAFINRLSNYVDKAIHELSESLVQTNIKDYSTKNTSLANPKKRILLDISKIEEAEKGHIDLVNLLNKYLREDEEPEIILQSNHINDGYPQSLKKNETTESTFKSNLNLTSYQEEVVLKIISNSFVLTKSEMEKFVMQKGYFKNQIIDEINEKCFEVLNGEPLIMEDDDDNYYIEESYYNMIEK